MPPFAKRCDAVQVLESPIEFVDEENDAEVFYDVPEAQDQNQSMNNGLTGNSFGTAETGRERGHAYGSDQMQGSMMSDTKRVDTVLKDRRVYDVAEEDEGKDSDDLFARTFGKSKASKERISLGMMSQKAEGGNMEIVQMSNDAREDHGDGDDDTQTGPFMTSVENTEKPAQDEASVHGTNTNLAVAKHFKGAHTGTSDPSTAATPPIPRGPQKGDVSPALQRYWKLHGLARSLIPQIALPKHRYWIAVLIYGKKATSVLREKDFIWMKGNRLTTVETVWHTYRNVTATEDFVLLCCDELMENAAQMRQLRYAGKLDDVNLVVLRAALKGTPGAKGRPMTQNLVPADEVVEILDDD